MKRYGEVDFIGDIVPLINIYWVDIINNKAILIVTVRKQKANTESILESLRSRVCFLKIGFRCKKCLFSSKKFKIRRVN